VGKEVGLLDGTVLGEKDGDAVLMANIRRTESSIVAQVLNRYSSSACVSLRVGMYLRSPSQHGMPLWSTRASQSEHANILKSLTSSSGRYGNSGATISPPENVSTKVKYSSLESLSFMSIWAFWRSSLHVSKLLLSMIGPMVIILPSAKGMTRFPSVVPA